MVVNEATERSLKRNADECHGDLPDLKVKKLEEEVLPCDDEKSSSQLSSASDSSAESTSDSQTTNSQSSSTGGAEMQNGKSILSPITNPEKNCSELRLIEGKVFGQMINEFSKVIPPTKITYDKLNYNLPAYEEFWETLFSLPEYTSGFKTKLVNSNLSKETLLTIAKILKRGWEDERFFPKQLANPFLEACIFNRESEHELLLKPKIFYRYIKKEEAEIIKSNGKTTIDEENLKVFQKYCPEASVSIGETIKSACKKALGRIMFTDVENARCVWTEELVGLLEFEKFMFLVKEQYVSYEIGEEIDVGTIAPHRLWSTFFYRWSDEMKEFYFKLLQNNKFDTCNMCHRCDVVAKHIVTTKQNDPETQTELHFRMLKERHDSVLNKIVKKVKIALNHSPYFTLGKENWELIVMHQNYRKPWPSQLAMLESLNLFPHMVLHCSSPRKRALIIEITVPWDHWATYGSSNYPKSEKYSPMIDCLKFHGFQAEYLDVNVGARGIWSDELYILFDKYCGMKRSEISKTMEKISKITIEVAYNFQHNNRHK